MADDSRTTASVNDLYSLKKIYRYERVFGPTWISLGSESITKEFCLRMGLKPGMKVLDIGCGTGGPVYHIARQFGCIAHGVDLSSEMIFLCNERLKCEEEVVRQRATFECGDITKISFPNNEFDVIYSKNSLLHIPDKDALFSRIQPWLKPGGKLVIADYVRGQKESSPDYVRYLEERSFFLQTFPEYANTLKNAGFRALETDDISDKFVQLSEQELHYFETCKEAFILDFSVEDYEWVINDWQSKTKIVKAGQALWGFFIYTK